MADFDSPAMDWPWTGDLQRAVREIEVSLDPAVDGPAANLAGLSAEVEAEGLLREEAVVKPGDAPCGFTIGIFERPVGRIVPCAPFRVGDAPAKSLRD